MSRLIINPGRVPGDAGCLEVAIADKLGVGEGDDEATLIRSLRQPLSIADGLSYSGTVGGLQVDFSLTPRGNRLEGNVSVGATYGGDAKFLGFTLAESEVPLATLFGQKRRSGEGCADIPE